MLVNIGSINGQGGQYGQVNYAAAKSGIHGFTKALAQEGANKGVTVNAIAPGYVDTDMVRAVPPPERTERQAVRRAREHRVPQLCAQVAGSARLGHGVRTAPPGPRRARAARGRPPVSTRSDRRQQ